MELFENFKTIVSETAQKVAKKSGEVVDATKVKYAIFDLNNDIKKLYSEMGKLTYLAVEEGEDHTDSIKMKCDIVKAKLAKIEALRLHSDDVAFKCPVCGKPSDNCTNYCPSCGADMTVNVECDVDTENE